MVARRRDCTIRASGPLSGRWSGCRACGHARQIQPGAPSSLQLRRRTAPLPPRTPKTHQRIREPRRHRAHPHPKTRWLHHDGKPASPRRQAPANHHTPSRQQPRPAHRPTQPDQHTAQPSTQLDPHTARGSTLRGPAGSLVQHAARGSTLPDPAHSLVQHTARGGAGRGWLGGWVAPSVSGTVRRLS